MRKNCKHILVIRQLPLTIRITNIVIKNEFTKFIEIKIAVGYITLPQIATLSLYITCNNNGRVGGNLNRGIAYPRSYSHKDIHHRIAQYLSKLPLQLFRLG